MRKVEKVSDRGRKEFIRFGLSGSLFTLLGPALFWLAYPIGPFAAVAVAEFTVHSVRFMTFKKFVFPANKGYEVSLLRYLLSALPTSITGLIIVALLRNRLDRTSLTLTGTLVTAIAGYMWSRFVYSHRPESKKRVGVLETNDKADTRGR